MPDPTPIHAGMPERDLQNHVLELAQRLGILAYHTHDSRRSQPGFPDLVLVGAQGVIYRELKTTKGKATATQQAWLTALTIAGQDADIWRPIDWPQRVLDELKGIR